MTLELGCYWLHGCAQLCMLLAATATATSHPPHGLPASPPPPAHPAGSVTWNEELSQIATLIKAPSGFEPKAYEFKLQAADRAHPQKPPATIGKAALDMAKFAASTGGAQQVALTVAMAGGGRAVLHLVVGAAEVKGMALDDDAMSVMTGASGLSSTSPSAWGGGRWGGWLDIWLPLRLRLGFGLFWLTCLPPGACS